MSDVVQSLGNIGSSNTRVGLVTVASEGTQVFFLNSFQTRDQVLTALDAVTFSGGEDRNLVNGLEAVSNVFERSNGEREANLNVLVSVIDQLPVNSDNAVLEAARALQNDHHVAMFSVGITDVIADSNVLRYLATSPPILEVNYFSVSAHSGLVDLTSDVASAVCDAVEPIQGKRQQLYSDCTGGGHVFSTLIKHNVFSFVQKQHDLYLERMNSFSHFATNKFYK